MAAAYGEQGGLGKVPAYVEDTGEVNWLVDDALHMEVPIPVICQSVMQLVASRDKEHDAARAIAMMRHGFGGHPFGADAGSRMNGTPAASAALSATARRRHERNDRTPLLGGRGRLYPAVVHRHHARARRATKRCASSTPPRPRRGSRSPSISLIGRRPGPISSTSAPSAPGTCASTTSTTPSRSPPAPIFPASCAPTCRWSCSTRGSTRASRRWRC